MLTIQDIATFCKKKGFIYASAEIYGGLAGFFDYGPLGVELKNNIKNNWWKTFVQDREDVVGIDGSIITNPMVWKASGHVDSFADILIECKKCRFRTKANQLIEEILNMDVGGLQPKAIDKIIKENRISCPKCKGNFGPSLKFNLMFKTGIGPVEPITSYLRPETAQLIFTNFKLVAENSRLKLPFGIAQIGKAYRNEISPRDFLFRVREFEQMEIEFFTHPEKYDDCPFTKEVQNMKINLLTAEMQEKGKKEAKQTTIKELITKNIANKWHAYWLAISYKWFTDLGINPKNLRLREHSQKELAHYASACFDIDYKYPFGWKELLGNADRKQFDLQQHIQFSKKDLSLFDEETKQKIIPYVASEPSLGVDRTFLTFLIDAYNDDKKRGNIVLKLHPNLAPIKAGIFPLVNKLDKEAKNIFNDLKKDFTCQFDKSGSIGRRYARADEIGIPYCITVDFDSPKKKDVTIRDRDTTKQIRVKIKDLKEIFKKLINQEIKFEKAGKLIK